MSIKITSDSTSDLSPALLEQYDITVLPLYVTMGEQTCRDGVDARPEDLFAYVERTGSLPTTAAVNVADYHDCFAQFSPRHEAVIHITISSDFSSCYQNACVAAEGFSNVYVVDSRNLSTGHGLVVLEAALAAQRGEQPEAIVAHLNEVASQVEASFVVDKLDYLVKGGRCSSAAALGANLLKLKPCIEVVDGRMKVGKKYRGNYDKVLLQYVRERLDGRDDLALDRIFVTHTPCRPETVEAVKAEIQTYAPFSEIIETTAGCTISSHCGPNTLGILFLRSRWWSR